MKQLLTILILFISINISAQKYEIYHCSTASMREVGEKTTEWKRNKVSFFIRINTETNLIEFGDEVKIYLRKLIVNTTDIDADGDKFVEKAYTAYDQNGRSCNFISIDYINLPARNFMLLYGDFEFHYSCVLINPKRNEDNKINNTLLQ